MDSDRAGAPSDNAGAELTCRSRAPDLGEVLGQALAVATDVEVRKLEALAGRLHRRRLRVLVAGEAKRGKSTLVNALLGRQLLPTGVTPLTAVTTTVSTAAADGPEHAVVSLLTGESRRIAIDDLATVVTETGNPGNTAGVDSVTVYVHNRLLDRHPVDLVDTPGTGSVYAHNTSDARRAFASLDAAVLVFSGDPPVTEAERDLLREIDRLSVRTFVVLNKSDLLSRAELAEAHAFTQDVCSAATGRPMPVRACSARAGDADPGFAAFTAELSDYLDRHGERDIDVAAAGHLVRALTGMLDARLVRVRALELAAAGQQDRVDQLVARLIAITERRLDIGDRCTGSLSRLRESLDRSAAAVVTPIARGCRQHLQERWDAELTSLPPADVEDRARAVVTAYIADAVDQWRATQVSSLERGLAEVIRQAEQDVAIQAKLAREAIQEVFEVTLESTARLPRLRVDPSFRYDFTRPEGWAAPLHGLGSRVGTASRRRERARRRVAHEVASLTDRQVGRARSDLQRGLERTGRAIRRALEEHLTEATEAFQSLLAATSTGPDHGRPEGGRDEQDALRAEAERLQHLLGRAGQPRTG